MNKFISKISVQSIAIALVIAIFFIADRILKILAFNAAALPPLKLVGNILTFDFTANYYMAFSLPFGGLPLNAIIISLIIALISVISFLAFSDKQHQLEIILLSFILLGAVSNIADRLIYGYVIDYLDLKNFTIFNLADAMISGGALILIFKNIRSK